jgi:predicted nucleic acid-binding protein
MILVDTSVLIDFLKGIPHERTQKFEVAIQQRIPFGINSLIFQEVLQGIKSDREYERLKEYLSSQRFYPLGHPVESFAAAAKIYMACRKKGITLRSTIDCLIVETAIEDEMGKCH